MSPAGLCRAAVLGSIGILATVWLLGPASPPLYDGLPIGTPPYRFLIPPEGSPHTPPPSSVSVSVVLADNPGGVSLATKEPRPQADVSIPTQLLDVPPQVDTVRVTVEPVPPPATLPKDGRIDGNVYRISVTTFDGRALRLRVGSARLFQVELLGTGSQREPHVEQYAGGSWVRLAFVHPEPGVFQFHPSQPGEFALVLPPDHSVFGPGADAAIAVGAALLLLSVILWAVRRRRGALAAGYEDGDDPSMDEEPGHGDEGW